MLLNELAFTGGVTASSSSPELESMSLSRSIPMAASSSLSSELMEDSSLVSAWSSEKV